jgi:PLP dependent protein
MHNPGPCFSAPQQRKDGADEKNRTSTALRQQASETCASTSSATSAREANYENTNSTLEYQDASFTAALISLSQVPSFIENLDDVRERISQAASRAGRNPDDVKLVAVSKTHPPEMIRQAMEAGVTVFGENKVQEGESKIVEIGRERAEWHLIGHLQSNKARKAVQLFDVIESLDSIDLAKRLERICDEDGRDSLSVFVQVDLARESTKSGIPEEELPELADHLKTCRHLKFDGLMILPPYFENADDVRPYFRRLREIRDEILPRGELSMGMSHDFDIAIEEGASVVRVGTAIFGERS